MTTKKQAAIARLKAELERIKETLYEIDARIDDLELEKQEEEP